MALKVWKEVEINIIYATRVAREIFYPRGKVACPCPRASAFISSEPVIGQLQHGNLYMVSGILLP